MATCRNQQNGGLLWDESEGIAGAGPLPSPQPVDGILDYQEGLSIARLEFEANVAADVVTTVRSFRLGHWETLSALPVAGATVSATRLGGSSRLTRQIARRQRPRFRSRFGSATPVPASVGRSSSCTRVVRT